MNIYQVNEITRLEYKVHGQTVECAGVFLEFEDRDVRLDFDLERRIFRDYEVVLLEKHGLTGED